jgi:AraC family ethanolamine operon transcriptional activator
VKKIFDSYLLLQNQFHDFDEMAVTAASAWDQRYRKIGKGPDFGFAHQLNMPLAQLSHIGWRSGLLIETGTPSESVGIVIQVAGKQRLRMNGRELGADRIALLHAPKAYDLLNAEGTTYIVLAVEAQRLMRYAEAHWGRLPGRFESLSEIVSESHGGQQAISALLHQYLDLSYGNPEYLNDPAVQDSVVDEMLDTVFLNSRMPVDQQVPRQRHQMARQAAQYLKDNIGQEISLRAMCEHTGVSERSLRQGFLECFGVTPKAFVRRVRLFQLHDTLKDPANEHSTITANALQLGVAHLGRLSSEYKAQFGELPSETLRRART